MAGAEVSGQGVAGAAAGVEGCEVFEGCQLNPRMWIIRAHFLSFRDRINDFASSIEGH